MSSNTSFKGITNTISKAGIDCAGDLAQNTGLLKTGNKIVNFIKRNFTEGYDITYSHKDKILNGLRENFGESFANCLDDIDLYNNLEKSSSIYKAKDKFSLHYFSKNALSKFSVVEGADDTITFHRDPFAKSVLENVKEFTVGSVLDLCNSARKLLNKINGDTPTPSGREGGAFQKVLDRRAAEKNARDAFYKVSGVFEKVNEGIGGTKFSHMGKTAAEIENETSNKITENITKLAKESIGKASKKVGKYNTKTERAWNRLGTGFVSATFASTDFYNISMLQNNDPEKANKSGRKRFMQDMRRQGLTAGITYVILGALQKSVNNSMLYAVLSLGGVTLISEILSRKIGGISLKPLSPKEAKEAALKNENKAKTKNEPPKQTSTLAFVPSITDFMSSTKVQTANPQFGSNPQSAGNVFAAFSSGYNGAAASKMQSGQNTVSPSGIQTPANNAAADKTQKEPSKKSNLPKNIAKFVLGGIGLSLGVGLLRSKNVFKINDAINNISSKYNDLARKITKKHLILPKEDVDGLFEFLNKNNFTEQSGQLMEALNKTNSLAPVKGNSQVVIKALGKNAADPSGLYYDIGCVDSKFKKTAFNLLTYPLNTVMRLLKNGNNIVRTIFGAKPKGKETKILTQDVAAEFMQKYVAKYKNCSAQNNVNSLTKELQDAFTRHFSEANSQNKNTSIAMISRFLITIISGYFFVNDYRNEVLIESKGEDVERANATMKERIGHKISNFFLNSMFMDLFNTTFENIYLGSVAGATAVAMATEFTNETAVRASICTPTSKMTREELIEYENERLNNDGPMGTYYRTFMKLTGKKPLSEKAKK